MFSKKQNSSKITTEDHELFENAQRRIRQKKKLYNHFVIFVIGSIFLVMINKVLKYGVTYNWFVWAITFWSFLFFIHLVNVFVTNRFMGKEWERTQRDKLVAKQRKKIAEMEKEIADSIPIEESNKSLPKKNNI